MRRWGIAGTMLLALLICVVVGTQTHALAADNLHHHSSQHCCALCHTGPLPLVRSAVAAAFAPSVPVSWFEGSSEIDAPRSEPLRATHSRAPPA